MLDSLRMPASDDNPSTLADLLLNPKPSWHKYSWLAEFAANIGHYRDNTIKTTQMAIAARQPAQRDRTGRAAGVEGEHEHAEPGSSRLR